MLMPLLSGPWSAGISSFTLSTSTSTFLSRNTVTVCGKKITIATSSSCSPTQGIAPR